MAKKKDIAGTIEVKLDNKCTSCGRPGTFTNGLCMQCTAAMIASSVSEEEVALVDAWITKTCNLIHSVLVRNAGGIEKIRRRMMALEEPEGAKLSLAVGLSPELTPKIEVGLRYSETYKDEVEGIADNPEQGRLELGK